MSTPRRHDEVPRRRSSFQGLGAADPFDAETSYPPSLPWDARDVPVALGGSERENALALARGAVDAELFGACRAAKRGKGDDERRRTLEAALGRFGDACRSSLRGALKDVDDESDDDWVDAYADDDEVERTRAAVSALEARCRRDAATLQALEREIDEWRDALPADHDKLNDLKHTLDAARGVSVSAADVRARMDADLTEVSAVAAAAREADSRLLAAAGAQRELYRAYEQAQFKDIPNARDPKNAIKLLGNLPPKPDRAD